MEAKPGFETGSSYGLNPESVSGQKVVAGLIHTNKRNENRSKARKSKTKSKQKQNQKQTKNKSKSKSNQNQIKIKSNQTQDKRKQNKTNQKQNKTNQNKPKSEVLFPLLFRPPRQKSSDRDACQDMPHSAYQATKKTLYENVGSPIWLDS